MKSKMEREWMRQKDLPGRIPEPTGWKDFLIDFAAYGTLAAAALVFGSWMAYVAYKLMGGK